MMETLEPYLDVLPFSHHSDMLGLVKRVTDKVCEDVLRSRSRRHYINDNASEDLHELLADPVVRLESKKILKDLFLNNLDAADSPKRIIDAAVELEEMLALREQQRDRAGR